MLFFGNISNIFNKVHISGISKVHISEIGRKVHISYNLMKNSIKPYLLINNIHRSHVDLLNRNIKKACNDKCESCKK